MDNLQEINEQLKQAQQNFDYADQDYIDAAIYELNAVNEKYKAMLREKRKDIERKEDYENSYRKKTVGIRKRYW